MMSAVCIQIGLDETFTTIAARRLLSHPSGTGPKSSAAGSTDHSGGSQDGLPMPVTETWRHPGSGRAHWLGARSSATKVNAFLSGAHSFDTCGEKVTV